MIPYLLALAGGYLIGSASDKQLFAKGGVLNNYDRGVIEEDMEKFVAIAKNSKDGRDFVDKARKVKNISSTTSDWFFEKYKSLDIYKAADMFVKDVKEDKFYIENYRDGGNIDNLIERYLVWQDRSEDDFQWSVVIENTRIQGVLSISKFSSNYDVEPNVTISDFDYVASSKKVTELWEKHKDYILKFVLAEIGRQHIFSEGQKFAYGGIATSKYYTLDYFKKQKEDFDIYDNTDVYYDEITRSWYWKDKNNDTKRSGFKTEYDAYDSLLSYLTNVYVYENGGKMADGGEIAKTILQQLGGSGKLNAMTGAYNFIDRGNGLSFKIKNQRANYIKITLNGKDLYDVEVGRIRGNTYKVVKSGNDLYFDELIPFLEEATGMYFNLTLRFRQ
jgi:hypothetical protein